LRSSSVTLSSWRLVAKGRICLVLRPGIQEG
jgi:hypothetical protein